MKNKPDLINDNTNDRKETKKTELKQTLQSKGQARRGMSRRHMALHSDRYWECVHSKRRRQVQGLVPAQRQLR